MKIYSTYVGLSLIIFYFILQIAVDILIQKVRRELRADERLRHVCENEPSAWYRRVGYYKSKTAIVSSGTAKTIPTARIFFVVSNLVLGALFLAFILGNILQRM
jgi:hypothetical protein